MHRVYLLAILLLLIVPHVAEAQWSDNFADGDFFNDPPWIGTVDQWRVSPVNGRNMLISDGEARSDTIFLATPSTEVYGSWSFRFGYRDVNMSNFNGARIFLISDTPDLRGDIHGYYLQLGTNNTKDVRLIRMDGDASQRRRELGRSSSTILEPTSATFDVVVYRDSDNLWQVWIDDELMISATDGVYRSSSHFGFWVKHTAATGQGYFFGDVEVTPGEAPEPEPLWIERVDVVGPTTLDVAFSGPVSRDDACTAANYSIDARSIVNGIECPGSSHLLGVRLRLSEPLVAGRHTLHVNEIHDQRGDQHLHLSAEFDVVAEDLRIFEPHAVTYDPRTPDQLMIEMSRAVDLDRVNEIELRISPPIEVREVILETDHRQIRVLLGAVPPPGDYVLELSTVYALSGEEYDGSTSFTVPRSPEYLDVVINEIHYAPPDQQLEFVELFNRSQTVVDLSHLDFAVTYDPRTPDQLMIEMSRAVDLDRVNEIELRISPPIEVREVILETDHRQIRVLLGAVPPPGDYVLELSTVYALSGEEYDGSTSFTVPRSPEYLDVVINEIHYAPPDQQLEFVELFNRSQTVVDLSHLDFADNRLLFTPAADKSHTIDPGGYAVLVRDSVAFAMAFPDVDFVQPPDWHVLNNSGDAVHLRAGSVVIDSLSFTSAWGSGTASIERIDPDAPSIRQNFGPSISEEGATPGARNSIFSDEHPRVDVIAVYESASNILDLVFSGPVEFPSSTSRISIDGQPARSVRQPSDVVLQLHHSFVRPAVLSIAGINSLFGDEVEPGDFDIAVRPVAGELIISEIMYDPLADPNDGLPDQPEYVEICSLGDRTLSLIDVTLADAPDENGMSRFMSHAEDYPVLQAGEYAVFSAEPDTGSVRLLDAFPEAGGHIKLLRVPRSTLGLPLRGRLIRLTLMRDAAEELELESVFYDPSWHHGAVREPRGRSLERIDPFEPVYEPMNWTTSVSQSGGTPGRPNSVRNADRATTRSIGLTIEPRVFAPDNAGINEITTVSFRLRAASSVVRARIFDSRGRLVRNLDASSLRGSEGHLTWDGYDDNRNRLPVGIYIVYLDSTDVETGAAEAYRDVVVLARPLR